MATKTSTLQLVIAGNNKGAVKAVEGTEKALGGLQGKLGTIGAGVGAGVVGAAALAGIKASTSAYIDYGVEVAKVKRLTGLSAEDASLLVTATKSAGVEVSKAAQGWTILSKNIVNGKVAADGIVTKDATGNLLDFRTILGNVADKIQSLPPGFQRTAEAQKLFGRGGAELVRVLQNGRQGIDDIAAAQEKYGTQMSGKDLDAVLQFKQAQRDANLAMLGIESTIGRVVVPALTQLEHGFTFFATAPAPIKDTALAVGALGAGVLLLSAGITGFNAIVAPGLATLTGLVGTSGAAAAATELLATAETAAAEAAAAEAVATEALTAALLAGGAAEAEFAVAAAARTAATEASAVASTTAAAASEGSAVASTAGASAMGAVSIAAPIAAAGLLAYSTRSKEAKANAESLAHATDEMKAAIASVDGDSGKGLDKFLSDNVTAQSARDLAEVGSNVTDLRAALGGSDAEWNKYIKSLDLSGIKGGALRHALNELRIAFGTAKADTKEQANNTDALGVSTDALTAKTDDLRTATERKNDAVKAALDHSAELQSNQDRYADSVQAVTDANADVVKSQQAVGEAQAQGAKDIADAEQSVVDASSKVADARRSVGDAERDLSQARKDAAKTIRDLEQAEIDAAHASIQAQVKLQDAKDEQRRVNANLKSTPGDKRDAAAAVLQAEDDARNAKNDSTDAENAATEAKAKGVEGDAQVVKAREAVADANRGVTSAEHDLADARRHVGEVETATAKAVTDARAQVLVAQKKSADASLDEAKAWGEVVTGQFGAIAGAQAYRDKLAQIAADLDPSNPLAQRIASLIQSITTAISTGLTQPYVAQYNNTGGSSSPGGLDPRSHPEGLRANQTLGGSSVTQNIQITVPTRSSGRAVSDMARKELDRIARGGR